MSETNGTLKYATTCMLPKPDGSPCGKQIIDHALNVEIVGQQDAKLKNFIQALGMHIKKAHPQAEKEIGVKYAHFANLLLPYLIMRMFQTEDPGLLQQVNAFASQLRLICSAAPLSDDEIQTGMATIGITMEDPNREKIFTALKNMQHYHLGIAPVAPMETSEIGHKSGSGL